ncbi:Ig-like domain-containing protein, partial [Bartonella sp. LJL80]
MASSVVLNNHVNINVNAAGGVVQSPNQPANFLISADKGTISNYSRDGNTLVIEFENGKVIKIVDFFANGLDFNNLVFIDQSGHWLTNFSNALGAEGDGIIDPEVYYEEIKDTDSSAVLLGILGGAAAIGGIAAALSGGSDGESYHPTAKPDAPKFQVVDDKEPYVGILLNNGFTNDTTPTFNGAGAAANGTITIKIPGYDPITVKVNADGTWTYTPPELKDGTYTVVITQTDGSGNVSDESKITFTVDTVAPNMPVLDTVYDNVEPISGNIEAGAITNDKTPTFSGTAEPNTLIKIYDEDGKVVGNVIVGKDGKWSIELPKDLTEGQHSFTITSTDPAGNESKPTPPFELVVDTVPPAALDEKAMDLIDDVGTQVGTIVQGTTTDDARPEYKGTVDPKDASSIEIYDNGKLIATVKVQSNGTWSFTPGSDLSDGSHTFTARAVDDAGNKGPFTSPWQFTVDTVAPSADDVKILGLTDDVLPSIGEIGRGGTTDDTTPTL